MAMYSKASYWDDRYRSTAEDGPCEWYQSFHNLRHLLNPLNFDAQTLFDESAKDTYGDKQAGSLMNCKSPRSSSNPPPLPFPQNKAATSKPIVPSFPSRDKCRVLILGCGNSTFGEDMQRDGWAGPIVNVDFSAVVIAQMKDKYNKDFYLKHMNWNKRNRPVPQMEFVCADMTTKLPFENQSFDLIVCKGSFDAVLCSAGSKANILFTVRECARLLSCGHGIFFLVTQGNPDSRIEYLEYRNNLSHYWMGVNYFSIPRPQQLGLGKKATTASALKAATKGTDYVYICRKSMIDIKDEERSDEGSAASLALNSISLRNDHGVVSSAAAKAVMG